jgi:nicotinamidase-related amidase
MLKGLKKAVVGSATNFWIWQEESGWDLTHPLHPDASPIDPQLALSCEISNVAIDPQKTALVIIDMQNFSMSSAVDGDVRLRVEDALLRYAIPAARKAQIQIIWLNWGLTEQDLETLPPAARRTFGWRANSSTTDHGIFNHSSDPEEMNACGESPVGRHPGAEVGKIQLPDGTKVNAGRALMRGAWNVELHGPLLSSFQEGHKTARPDVQIFKNRNSGLYDSSCDCTKYLETSGIRTLLFAGMNTDQCVMGTLQDAHSRGFDTILLRDGCATRSPRYAQQSAELNCCQAWGFLSSCRALAKAANLKTNSET